MLNGYNGRTDVGLDFRRHVESASRWANERRCVPTYVRRVSCIRCDTLVASSPKAVA
jgi:hypothetical protein